MKSIYFKSFVVTAVTASLCCFIIALCSIAIGWNYVTERSRSEINETALECADLASAMVNEDNQNDWQFSLTLSAIAGSTGEHIFYADSKGSILLCSDKSPSCEHTGKTIDDSYLQTDSGKAVQEYSGDLNGILKEKAYISVVAVSDTTAGGVKGYIITTLPVTQTSGPIYQFVMIAVLIAAGVACFAMVASLVTSKKVSQPLDDMADAARQYATGNFSVRVKQRDDVSYEMGTLIDAFNKMADSIETTETRRTEFISNISHELRTPMTTIAGFADGILDGTIRSEDQKKYLISIRDETRRLARLTQDMLEASRVKPGGSVNVPAKWSVFDISELTVRTLLSFEARANQKHMDVDAQLPDDSIMVRADKDAINRVIYNLLDNALKFCNENSVLTLRIYKDKGKAFISVKDEGETIPPDDLPYIFDRFHKSDRSRSLDKTGVGLGLYFVKTIINNHGEDIVVRSENGITEFVFSLPLAENTDGKKL